MSERNCKECPVFGSCGDYCDIDFEHGSCKYSRMSHYEVLEAKYQKIEREHKHYKSCLGSQVRHIFESAARYGYEHGHGGNLLDNMFQDWLSKEGKRFISAIEEANNEP